MLTLFANELAFIRACSHSIRDMLKLTASENVESTATGRNRPSRVIRRRNGSMTVYRVEQSPDTATHEQQLGLCRLWLRLTLPIAKGLLLGISRESMFNDSFCNQFPVKAAAPNRSHVKNIDALNQPEVVQFPLWKRARHQGVHYKIAANSRLEKIGFVGVNLLVFVIPYRQVSPASLA